MRKAKKAAGHKYPLCGKTENQVNSRKNKGAFAMIAKNTTRLNRKHESILKISERELFRESQSYACKYVWKRT